jgi:TonB-dependent starch-binding outer membrane protein SusC
MRKFLSVSLLFLVGLLGTQTAWAQQRTVTGKVTSAEDQAAIPGASVVLKGSTRGTTTDAAGNYSLGVPAEGGTLVVSFVGTTQQEVVIGNQSVIDVKLVADTRQLTEVVVTGVGVATTKAKLGIAVESVSAKDLPPAPTASIDQALVGKIAGAQIVSANGTPGARANILLRGINTVNRGTAPMVMMDGVQVGATDINTLDLSTIDRIEVIQGAAASTLYGAQGANGVIQLFSKRGQDGPVRVSFSNSYATNDVLNIGNLRKADKHAFVTDASNNVIGVSGKPLSLDPATTYWTENVQYNALDVNSNANKAYDQNLKYYDHYGMFFRPSVIANNSVNISGGNGRADFAITLSNLYQTSNIKNNGEFNRTNLVANIGVNLAKNLTLRSVTQLAYTRNSLKVSDRTLIYSLNNTRPFNDYDYVDPDGNYGAYYGSASGVNGYNPNYYLQNRTRQGNKVDLLQSLDLSYKPFKWVDLNARYGLNYQTDFDRRIFPNQSQNRNIKTDARYYDGIYAPDEKGEIRDYNVTTVFQNAYTSALFKTDFKEDFKLNVPIKTSTLIGFDYRKNVQSEYVVYGTGMPLYQPVTTAQAGTYRVIQDDVTPFVTYGYLFSQNIEFGEFGGVTGTYRADYSSAFGRGSTPFGFPAGSAYVRPSSFNFWQNSTLGRFIPEFKIRAAYGEAGIQPKPFDRYVTLATKTLGTSNVFYYGANQNNPDLNVEVSRELEMGTDFTVTGGNGDWLRRLNFSFSYWKRNTDNAIYNVDVAPSTGVGSLKDNAFGLESRGIQFSLNTTLYRGRDITWDFVTNFGRQTSEIASVKGNAEITVTSSAGSTNFVLRKGEKIGQLFGFIALTSLNQILPDGTPAMTEAQKPNFEVASNGYVVNKTTKQPLYSSKQYSLGDPNPDFNISFINSVAFRDFVTLGFQFDWTQGSHVYNQTKSWMYRDGIHSDYATPFTVNGQTGAWTAYYRGIYQAGANNGTKSYFYEDASFVRLRNVSLRFNINKMLPRLPVRNLQLELSGRNVLTWTKYTGMDPEVSSGQTQGSPSNGGGENSAWDRGIDHNTMPNLRSYQIGLNFGF